MSRITRLILASVLLLTSLASHLVCGNLDICTRIALVLQGHPFATIVPVDSAKPAFARAHSTNVMTSSFLTEHNEYIGFVAAGGDVILSPRTHFSAFPVGAVPFMWIEMTLLDLMIISGVVGVILLIFCAPHVVLRVHKRWVPR